MIAMKKVNLINNEINGTNSNPSLLPSYDNRNQFNNRKSDHDSNLEFSKHKSYNEEN